MNNAALPVAGVADSGRHKSRNASGAEAIERYINQRDKLWLQHAQNRVAISSVAINLLKDRNDFVKTILSKKKIIGQLFAPERLELEEQRTRICEAFIKQLQAEQQALVRAASFIRRR